MSYLNSLPEQLRPVAREVFSPDPNRSVNLTNTNRNTRMYLRRIIQRAKNPPFNLTITDRQLYRLFRIRQTEFLQWFRHDVRLAKVFRRVRWFLREMIRLNILEDRGELGVVEDLAVEEKPIKWPNKTTKAVWNQRTEAIQEEHRNRGPVINNLTDAVEIIGWMQSAYSPSSSFEDDNESINAGEYPDEEREVGEDTYESTEFRGLNGPRGTVPVLQLCDQFKNTLIICDKSHDVSNDDKVLSFDLHDSLDQELPPEDGHSKYYE